MSFRRDGLKYIATLGGTLDDGAAEPTVIHEELYDLTRDRGELQDLALERTKETQTFRALLRRYVRDTARLEQVRRAAPVTLDEETKRLLKGLGYVSH